MAGSMGVAKVRSAGARLSRRQAEILDIVTRQGYAAIDDLASRFKTSHQTIRRDIIWLDRERVLKRFHGGVGLIDGQVRPGYEDKRHLAIEAKRKIAARAVCQVEDRMTLFVDVGTTAEALAHALLQSCRAQCRVVTTSLSVALVLADHPTIETIVAAGLVHTRDGAVVGPLAVALIEQFSFDYAFIGFSGFDADGAPMDFDLGKVLVKRAAIGRAATAIGLVDSTKFRRRASIRMVDPGDLDQLISEAPPSGELARHLAEAGVEVVLADEAPAPHSPS